MNKELFNLIATHESGLYEREGKKHSYTHLEFGEIEKLTNYLGSDYFVDGPMDEVQLTFEGLVVDTGFLIEREGHTIQMYKDAYNTAEYYSYFEE